MYEKHHCIVAAYPYHLLLFLPQCLIDLTKRNGCRRIINCLCLCPFFDWKEFYDGRLSSERNKQSKLELELSEIEFWLSNFISSFPIGKTNENSSLGTFLLMVAHHCSIKCIGTTRSALRFLHCWHRSGKGGNYDKGRKKVSGS